MAESPFLLKAKSRQLEETLKPKLDPIEDLTPFERAAKDQLAKGVKPDRSSEYFTGSNLDKTTEAIVTDEYGQKLEALDAFGKTLPSHDAAQPLPPGAHYAMMGGMHPSEIDGINTVGYPFGPQPSGGNLGTGDPSPMASPLGTTDQQSEWMPNPGDPNEPGSTGAPSLTNPSVTPSQVMSPEYKRLGDEMANAYQNYPDPGSPNKPQPPTSSQIGLGLILSLIAPGAAPYIAQAMGKDSVEQAKFQDQVQAAQYAAKVHGVDKTIAAITARMRMMEQYDTAQANQNLKAQTTNAQEAGKNQRAEFLEYGRMTRQERSISTKEEIAHLSDDTKRYIAGLKDPVQKVKALVDMGYDAAQARDMANSEDLNRLATKAKTQAQTAGIKLDNTYKERTMVTRISQAQEKLKDMKSARLYTDARTRYTTELTKYIPQNEAFKWASLMALINFRDRSLDIQGERLDESVDKSVLSGIASGYDKAQESVDMVDDMLANGIGPDGQAFDKDNPEDATTKALTGQKKLYEAMRDRAAQAMERAQEKAQIKKDTRGTPFQGIKGRLTGMGNRFQPMPGNVPVDPTGPSYERTKVSGSASASSSTDPMDDVLKKLGAGGLQSDTNFFLEGIA